MQSKIWEITGGAIEQTTPFIVAEVTMQWDKSTNNQNTQWSAMQICHMTGLFDPKNKCTK